MKQIILMSASPALVHLPLHSFCQNKYNPAWKFRNFASSSLRDYDKIEFRALVNTVLTISVVLHRGIESVHIMSRKVVH